MIFQLQTMLQPKSDTKIRPAQSVKDRLFTHKISHSPVDFWGSRTAQQPERMKILPVPRLVISCEICIPFRQVLCNLDAEKFHRYLHWHRNMNCLDLHPVGVDDQLVYKFGCVLIGY